MLWHEPMHRFVPYPSQSTWRSSASSSSQVSHSIWSSRPATVMSSYSTYARMTWLGVLVGCPRRSRHRSSHSFSMESRIAGDMSCFMYRSRQMAVASMSQCFATCPTHLHVAHWTSGKKGRRLRSGRANCPGPRGKQPRPQAGVPSKGGGQLL